MMLWLAIAFACDTPTTTGDVRKALDAAEGAFAGADLDGFSSARDTTRQAVTCLGEPLPSGLAAELHRMEGLAAFFAEEAERAPQAFASARRLEPDYRFPEEQVPPGNPLLDVYFTADPFSPPAVSVPEPAEGSLRFDGKEALSRPMSGPTVMQLLDGSGSLAQTTYLWPGQPLPAYAQADGVEAEPEPVKASLKRPLLIGAAGAAVASGALFAANVAVHNAYDDATDLDTLDRVRGLNNGLSVGSGVTLALGVGLGVGGLLAR